MGREGILSQNFTDDSQAHLQMKVTSFGANLISSEISRESRVAVDISYKWSALCLSKTAFNS